jgi:hypothetical protein
MRPALGRSGAKCGADAGVLGRNAGPHFALRSDHASAKHRGRDAQLAAICVNGRPLLPSKATASRLNSSVGPPQLTTALTHSTPFRSPRSLAKVSTNSGEVREPLLPVLAHGALPPQTPLLDRGYLAHSR